MKAVLFRHTSTAAALIAAGIAAAPGRVDAQPSGAKQSDSPVAPVSATPRAGNPALAPGPDAAPAAGAVAVSLEQALAAAEPAAESLVAAKSDVDRAQAQVDAARASWFPQVNGSASYTRQIRSEFEDISFGDPSMMSEDTELPFGQRNTWRVGVIASQSLFDGFRTSRSVDQAKAGVRASELGVKQARAQLVLSVAQAYFDAALAERQVEIAEVTLGQAEETLQQTQLSFEQGAAPEFDLVRAQVTRDNEATALVRFKTQRDVAFVQLRRLIGQPLDQPLTLTSRLDADDVDAVVRTAGTAAGIAPAAQRAAIAQAKETVIARQAGLGVAKSEWWPQLGASTDFGLVDYAGHPFNSDWRTNWTVAVTLSVPIFDGFRRRAQVKTARAEVATAKAQLADASERADVEVKQATASVDEAATTLETSTRTVGQARRAYEIAELRFTQGASNHLELVDARVQLEQSLLNQARAARDLRVARLRQALLPGLPLGM